jgi:hypothetical protein
MRFHKAGVIAAAALALALGTGTAYAGTGPAPTPSARQTAAARSTAPTPAGNPADVRAQASGVCSDAYQIGSTTYFQSGDDGATFGSLKQFYSPSCKQNYGYFWVWDSYVQTHSDPYTVTVGILDTDHPNSSEEVGTVTTKDTRQQEFWSEGTDTVQDCTRAYADFQAPEWGVGTATDLRC